MGKSDSFDKRLIELQNRQNYLFNKKNKPIFSENGIYSRHKNPIITRDHIPLHWRFDLNREMNPSSTSAAAAVRPKGAKSPIAIAAAKNFLIVASPGSGTGGLGFCFPVSP